MKDVEGYKAQYEDRKTRYSEVLAVRKMFSDYRTFMNILMWQRHHHSSAQQIVDFCDAPSETKSDDYEGLTLKDVLTFILEMEAQAQKTDGYNPDGAFARKIAAIKEVESNLVDEIQRGLVEEIQVKGQHNPREQQSLLTSYILVGDSVQFLELIETRMDVNYNTSSGNTPLHLALANDCSVEGFIEPLLRAGAQLDKKVLRKILGHDEKQAIIDLINELSPEGLNYQGHLEKYEESLESKHKFKK